MNATALDRTPANPETPYLSIVVTSRNDGHGGSPLARTQTFLDSLADQCRRHSLAAELMFVEWNPPTDRPRLCRVLRQPVQPDTLNVRFIEVPAETHQELANHDKMGLFQMIAKNVGIRRSRGEFVLATNIDLLFSEELIAFLAERKLRDNTFYVAERHDLGVYSIPEGLFGPELMDFARRNVTRINYQLETRPVDAVPPVSKNGYLHTNACGDFTLMSRSAWERFSGYAELQLYSIHIDSLGLFSARAAGLSQCELTAPLNTFHIEHGGGWMTDNKKIVATKPALSYFCDCQPFFYWTTKNGVAPKWNDPDWGYGDCAFRECGFSGQYDDPAPGTFEKAVERHRHWLELAAWNRVSEPRVRNSPEDLARLETLAARHKPELAVAFGCDPLRLAALATVAESMDFPVLAYGGNAPAIATACELLPVDPQRIRNADEDMETMDFPEEFEKTRLFLLIDAAALSGGAIANIMNCILPRVTDGSLILFDNVWHSPQLLSPEIARIVFHDRLLPRLNATDSARCQFQAYHEGGSLIGLANIPAIAGFINGDTIRPCLASRRKGIWFTVDRAATKTEWPGIGHPLFERGEISYAPLHDLMQAAAEEIVPEKMPALLNSLAEAGLNPDRIAAAKAICLVAGGRSAEALRTLTELGNDDEIGAPAALLRSRLEERLAPTRSKKRGEAEGLTIFTTAKPFVGHAGAIQRNALKSWASLDPRPEILIFGDEEGVREFAGEINARQIPSLRRNEFGCPLVNDMFRRAQEESTTRMLAYVNADIILLNDFPIATQRIGQRFPAALGVGQRWEIPIPDAGAMSETGWREKLRRFVLDEGFYEGCLSADYFIFTPGIWPGIPPFALGRMYWDNWLIVDARERGVPVVDASDAVLAVHQNHDYSHMRGGRREAWHGLGSKRNKALFGRNHLESTMAIAEWVLAADGRFTHLAEARKPDAEDNKRRRFEWLMRQSRRLLDQGRLEAAAGMMEELRVRTFPDRAAIDERLGEYECLMETANNAKRSR